MQLVEKLRDSIGFAATPDAGGSYDSPVRDEADQDPPGISEAFVVEVFAAVADMALRSKRQQADLDAALCCARIECERSRRMAVLERLCARGYVDKLIELRDGGVLLSVTALGLDRLGGRPHR